MKDKKYYISNINGSNDITSIRSSISELDGVKAVRVDTVASSVTVDFDENKVSEKEIRRIIDSYENGLR